MKRLALTITAILTLLLGCSKTEETSNDVAFTSSTQPPATQTSAPTTAPTSTAAAAQDANVARSTSGDGVSIAHLSEPAIEIVEGGRVTTMRAETKDSGKRKYYVDAGTQLLEVKSSDSGFKVRTPDGALLWKIKISDDKIKVSDNEENQNAWVLKTKYSDKAKILDPAETEIGEVRFADPPSPTRVRTMSGSDAWTVEVGRASPAWGVLMMQIPRDHQAVIIAELLSRGL